MDYLDPKKEFRHRIILLSGYVLLAVAIVTSTLVLLKTAYGFGVKNGTVIQNGWAFFSSQPNAAYISVNGAAPKASTNTRLELPGGIYSIKLSRTGYHDWQRTIELNGGTVTHYDYPLLIPATLDSKKIMPDYPSAPGLLSQSPDQRWIIVQQPGSMTAFYVYDLKNPTKPPVALTLPPGLLSKVSTHEIWQLDEWADDNQHIVLKHIYDEKTEFILLDRTSPELSVNLNNVLTQNPTRLTLADRKYDRYFLYSGPAATLQTASLKTPEPVTVLTHVLEYRSYSDDTLLYATDSGETGKIQIRLKIRERTALIRTLPPGTTYLLDLTKYSGTMYVVAGAASQNKVYIYKDPIAQLSGHPDQAVTPIQVLHVVQPNYLSFSPNAQYIVAENGSHFGVYDIENKSGFNYVAGQVLDSPQLHAGWMDGNRLTYVSGGKLIIFDYDHTNPQVLMPASSNYLPAFAPNYKDVYTLVSSGTGGQFEFIQTSLLLPADR